MEEQIWKQLYEYSDYEVSNFGEIRSVYRQFKDSLERPTAKKSKTLKPLVNGKVGAQYVQIMTLGKKKTIYIHKAVADHFVPNENKEELRWVIHLDGDYSNNRWDNLKWVKRSEIATAAHSRKADVSKLPVMATYCKTCPFKPNENGFPQNVSLANAVTERTLFNSQQICHGTEGENREPRNRCYGSFEHNSDIYEKMGLYKEEFRKGNIKFNNSKE